MRNNRIAVIATYLAATIIAFGHSYNYDYDPKIPELNKYRAIACGVFWPLYFSKVAFEGYRK